ncbi:MAG TPA: hypothetical protein VI365_36535 [Trebonia sp.]
MLTEKELTLSPAGTVTDEDDAEDDAEDDGEVDEEVDGDDEQAAAVRATTAAAATQPTRGRALNVP